MILFISMALPFHQGALLSQGGKFAIHKKPLSSSLLPFPVIGLVVKSIWTPSFNSQKSNKGREPLQPQKSSILAPPKDGNHGLLAKLEASHYLFSPSLVSSLESFLAMKGRHSWVASLYKLPMKWFLVCLESSASRKYLLFF